mgnify:CR=1 FL=1
MKRKKISEVSSIIPSDEFNKGVITNSYLLLADTIKNTNYKIKVSNLLLSTQEYSSIITTLSNKANIGDFYTKDEIDDVVDNMYHELDEYATKEYVDNVVEDMTGLPENVYIDDEDIYIKKLNLDVQPVNHPDISTQPSIIPQRFGKYKINEVLVPIDNAYLDADETFREHMDLLINIPDTRYENANLNDLITYDETHGIRNYLQALITSGRTSYIYAIKAGKVIWPGSTVLSCIVFNKDHLYNCNVYKDCFGKYKFINYNNEYDGSYYYLDIQNSYIYDSEVVNNILQTVLHGEGSGGYTIDQFLYTLPLLNAYVMYDNKIFSAENLMYNNCKLNIDSSYYALIKYIWYNEYNQGNVDDLDDKGLSLEKEHGRYV